MIRTLDALPDWTRRLWIYPALAIVVAAPYALSGAMKSDFTFDDIKLVRDNETIRNLGSLSILEILDVTSDRWKDAEVRPNYRPVRFLSYALDYEFSRWLFSDFDSGPPPPHIFHVTNLLLHVLNTLMVFVIGRRLLGSGLPALALALLFGLHPVQTEAVAYISGRRDVLSTFFFLAALALFVRTLPDRASRAHGGEAGVSAAAAAADIGWGTLVAVPVLFVLGFFSKEMVVTLPAVLVLIDLALRVRPRPRRLALHLVLWGVAIAVTFFKVRDDALVAEPLGGDWHSVWLMAPRYVLRYLGLLLAPLSLSLDYSFDAIPVSRGLLSPWTTLPSLLAVVSLMILGLVALGRRWALLALGLLWFLGTLTPVLQFVPIPERFAERFVYLPGLGVLLRLAAGYASWERRALVPARTVLMVVVVALALRTYTRCRDWRTPFLVWEAAAEAQPDCARAHIASGNELRSLEGRYLRDAVAAYSRAIEIVEGDPASLETEALLRGHLFQARSFRADTQMKLGATEPGAFERAIEDFDWLLAQEDIDGSPVAQSVEHMVLWYHKGQAHYAMEENVEARKAFEQTLELGADLQGLEPGPRSLVRAAHYFLGKIDHGEHRLEAAIGHFRDAFEIAREWGTLADRFNLSGEYADALIDAEEYDRADELLAGVIEAMGDDPERKHLLFRRAKIHDQRAEVNAAASTLEDCLRIDPKFGAALLSLASLEETRGNLERAAELYREVEKQAPNDPAVQRGLESVQIKLALRERPADEKETQEKRSVLSGLLSRGRREMEAGKLFAAETLFKKAADAAPHPSTEDLRGEALHMLGRLSERLKKYGAAEGFYLSALEVDVAAHRSVLALADLLLAHYGQRKRAAELYSEYVRRVGDEPGAAPHAFYNLAVLIQKESPQEAIEFLERSLGLGHDRSLIALQLGHVYADLEKWGESLDHFRDFLEHSEDVAQIERVRKFVNKTVIPNYQRGDRQPDDDDNGHDGGDGER